MTRIPHAWSNASAARSALPTLGGILGCALLAALPISAEPAARAQDVALHVLTRDLDQDGLIDAQERLMRTRVRAADSDGDGFSDLEELARHSSPRFVGSVPSPQPIDVGSAAHYRDGRIHAVFAIYAADGSFADKHLTIGAWTGERTLEIPAEVLWRTGQVRVLPARQAPGRLLVLDLPIPTGAVVELQQLALFASVADVASKQPGRLDTIELLTEGATIYHRAFLSREELASTLAATSSGSGTSQHVAGHGGQEAPTVLIPLHVEREASLPTSSQGEICLQRSVAVGVGRGVIVHEVVASECVEGWEGTCASDCTGRVGSTFTSPDPVVYAGG